MSKYVTRGIIEGLVLFFAWSMWGWKGFAFSFFLLAHANFNTEQF